MSVGEKWCWQCKEKVRTVYYSQSTEPEIMINKYNVEQPGFFLTAFIEIYNSFVNSVVHSSDAGGLVCTWCGRIGFRVSGTIEGYIIAMEEKTVPVQDELNQCRKYTEIYQELYSREVTLRKRLAGFILEAIDTESMDNILYVIRKQQPSVTMRVNTNGCVFELFVFTEIHPADHLDSAHLDSAR